MLDYLAEALQSLELLIRDKLIPAILGGREVTDELRIILSLPARLGGMGFLNPCEEADGEYANSLVVNAQLTQAIFEQKQSLEIDEEARATSLNELKARKRQQWKERQEHVNALVTEKMRRIVQLGAEKGEPTWLTSLPLKSYGFRLNKQQFHDALCMRYDLKLNDVPRNCTCGDEYSVNHCLTCKLVGYVVIRHNAVRDTLA